MTHDELRELYELYALGVLERDERDEIEAHLKDGCQACRDGIRRAESLNAALLSLSPDTAPPRKLRKRVLASAGADRQTWGWMIGWGMATAGLLVATLWFSADARRTTSELASARKELGRSNSELTRVQAVLEFLNSPETRQVMFGEGAPQPARGRVLVNPASGVLLVASNLPDLPPGKTYEMWVIPKGGAPKPAGLFRSDPRGGAIHWQRGPVDLSTTGAVAVSVEPESGSTAPTTTPIIVAPVAGP
jgi:anti-sigma-K factor RskA